MKCVEPWIGVPECRADLVQRLRVHEDGAHVDQPALLAAVRRNHLAFGLNANVGDVF
jgi:hypothetical protein